MPMSHETSLVERDGRVATITLNRPKALNALNGQVMTELTTAAAEFDAESGIGAIVITGSEKAFAAGADIKQGFERCQPVTSRPSAMRAMLHSCTSFAPS
jgi:enoyl-CoA hydratase/carnithine racemase